MITPSDWMLNGWRGFRTQALFVLLMAFAAGCWPAELAAAPQWRVLETPRFTVVSQLGEPETRAWAEEFNQFIEALNQIFRIGDNLLPRLSVVIFANEADFKSFLPKRSKGKDAELAGIFSRQETWAVIALTSRLKEKQSRETIFHEGVHWLVSAYPVHVPLFINEGLAEVFSTFKVSGTSAVWGTPIPLHVLLLNHQKTSMLSLRDMIHVSPQSNVYSEEQRAGIFYAQSWAFVHYLLFGQRQGARSALDDFLLAYSKESSTDEAFKAAFGLDFGEMDILLRSYISSGKYALGTMKVDPGKSVQGEFLEAAPAVVEMAFARLAFCTGQRERALKHIAAAVRLAPENAACLDTQACLLNEMDPGVGGVAEAKKAVALGSKDGWSHMLAAVARARAALALGGIPPKEARQIANQFEMALNLRPNLRQGYHYLALLVGEVEKVSKEDVLFLRQGLTLFPEEAVLYLGLAQIARKAGQKETARNLLARAVKNPRHLEVPDQEFCRQLEQRWIMEDMESAVVPLWEAGKFREALAKMDELLQNDRISDRIRVGMMKRRAGLALFAKFEMAREATREERWDDAKKLLVEISESTDATPPLKAEVRERLENFDDNRKRLEAAKGDAADEEAVPETPAGK